VKNVFVVVVTIVLIIVSLVVASRVVKSITNVKGSTEIEDKRKKNIHVVVVGYKEGGVEGKKPLAVKFIPELVGSKGKSIEVTSCGWYIGDKLVSDKRVYTDIFKEVGETKIKLLVQNALGDVYEKDLSIRVVKNYPPKCALEIIPEETVVGGLVNIRAKCVDDGRITKIKYDYGDGSQGMNSYHIYKEVGSYMVTVTAYDDSGDYTQVQEAINVIGK